MTTDPELMHLLRQIKAGGGGGSALEVQNDGTPLTTDAALLNFATGLVATEPAVDEITVNFDETISPTWTGDHIFDSFQTWLEQTTPAGSPPTGYWRVYMKADGELYAQDDAGNEVQLSATAASTPYEPHDIDGNVTIPSGESSAVVGPLDLSDGTLIVSGRIRVL